MLFEFYLPGAAYFLRLRLQLLFLERLWLRLLGVKNMRLRLPGPLVVSYVSTVHTFFRLTKKEKEDRKEKEKKREEDKNKLLFDWSEDENEEAEEFKKIQVQYTIH